MTNDLSIVLATWNRREVLLHNLERLYALSAVDEATQVIVVDNASTDGTVTAVQEAFPQVELVALTENRGSCAKALGIDRARGELLLLLDDDSCPQPGSLERMHVYFSARPRLAAAGFVVHLPDGRLESCALPRVFVGCGVALRREALRQAGNLDLDLFMIAEEYDLAFRLVADGWEVDVFADLHVDHDKTPQARASEQRMQLDTRNNLLLAARYLPAAYEADLRADWEQRYRWLAADNGCAAAFERGRAEAMQRYDNDRAAWARWRLDDDAVDHLCHFTDIGQRLAELRDLGVRRLVLAALGKNILPFVRGAHAAGIELAAIVDRRFGGDDRVYRGIPVCTCLDGLSVDADAVVVSNTSPAHAPGIAQRVEAETALPVHRWFGYDRPPFCAEPPAVEDLPDQPLRLPGVPV